MGRGLIYLAVAATYLTSGCSLGPLKQISPPIQTQCDFYETSILGNKLIGADCDGEGIDMVLTEDDDSIVRLTNGVVIRGMKAHRVTPEYAEKIIGNPVQVFSSGEMAMAERRWQEYQLTKQSGNQR